MGETEAEETLLKLETSKGWGDGSVGSVLASQACLPEVESWNSRNREADLAVTYNLSPRGRSSNTSWLATLAGIGKFLVH